MMAYSRVHELVSRVVRFTYRFPERMATIGRKLTDVFWFALLPDETLEALTLTHYASDENQYARDDYNAQGLFGWERRAIDDFFPKSGRILITSAGGGREAIALAARGYDVVATECSPRLAEELRWRMGESRVFPGSEGTGETRETPVPHRDPYALPDGAFDGAIVGWGGYSHMPGQNRRVSFLRDLAWRLPAGAPVLLSFLTRSSGRLDSAVRAVANPLRMILRRRPMESGESIAEGSYRRFFAPGEAAAEAREAGFDVVRDESEGYAHLVLRKIS